MVVACSFLPAATSMIYELGLQELLHGVTFECPARKPRVVRSVLEGKNLSSSEIDQVVAESVRRGESLYWVDMELLRAIAPDVVFTQHLCDLCQIGTSVVERAVSQLEKVPRIVPLVPNRLADVYENARSIAGALGHPERGVALVERLKRRTDAITGRLRARGTVQRRVLLLEWLEPLYTCGHWLPDQIALAGGMDQLGNPGGHSQVTPWERIVQYDPEVLVIAACGFSVERTRQEMHLLTGRAGWASLRAVQNGEVYLVDGDLFTRPSTTLVDGIEMLAALFHPQLFQIPANHRERVLRATGA